MDVCDEALPDTPNVAPEAPPTYVVEVAKSGRAECKKCDCKIENKTIRVGVLVEGEWGLFTRWQHLDCTVFRGVEDVEALDGYLELKAEQKAEVAERVRASADEEDEDNVPVEPDELVRKSWNEAKEPSPDLLMPLLAYQKEGLGWMVHQELNDAHGGILADEMGMGKTIQAISLMLENRPDFSDFAQMRDWATSDERHQHSSSAGGAVAELTKASTLIVLPTVAIRQWQTEIARFTRSGALTVKVYHGSDRNTTVQDLTTADVVLTSYKILEIEYRKATAGTKVTCRICGKKFYPDKLRVHRKYFCGESAQRTEAQSLTQKKKQRVMLPGSGGKKGGRAVKEEGSDQESDGSEDSIAQQKRKNKEQAEKKERAAAARKEKQAAKTADKKAAAIAGVKALVSGAKQGAAKGRGKAAANEKPAAKGKKTAAVAAPSDGGSDGDSEVAWESASENDSEPEEHSGDGPVLKPSATPTVKSSKKSAAKATPATKSAAAKGKQATPAPASKRGGVTPASGKKASTAAKVTTPAATATMEDEQSAEDSEHSGPPIKRRSPRAQARVPRQYFVEPKIELGSDDDGAGSVDSGGDGVGADAESEYGESDADKEVGGKSGEVSESSTDSDTGSDDGSDAPTSESDGAAGKTKAGKRSRAAKSPAGSAVKKSPAASKASPKQSTPRGKVTAASKASSGGKSAAKASAVKGAGRGKRPANPFGRPPAPKSTGKKRGRAAEESEEDCDTSDAAEDAEDSASGSDSGDDSGAAADGVDEEVERDIQAALAEAAQQLRKSKQAPAQSILHLVSWFRIILDEAHLIKDRSTSTAKAVFNLVSLNKWCLTGTPLQNRVGELYSLIRFLRIDPHAYYYCRTKGCTCKSLHYRFTQSKCDDCGHSVIQHFCHFNKHILNPIKRSGYVSEGRKAMLKLKNQVLDEILLRRTKMTRAEDIQLPPRIVRVRQEKLDVKEEDFYSALYTQSQAQFNTYLQSGTVLNNYAHIFDILIRLRQAVDHPYLVIYSDAQTAAKKDSDMFLTGGSNEAEEGSALVQVKAEKDDCDLCHEPWEDPVSAQCGHSFCRACITDYIDSMSPAVGNGAAVVGASPAGTKSSASKRSSSRTSSSPSTENTAASAAGAGLRCPDCDRALTICLDAAPATTPAPSSASKSRNAGRSTAAVSEEEGAVDAQQGDGVSVWDASKSLSRKSILDRIDLNLFQSSTKIEALMEELYKMQSEDLGAKAIVFSQFVNMLDLINFRLQRGGLGCVKLSGSMNLEQRDKAITAFKTDPAVKVMLISLKAGGVALNLTVASRIFLMDPWWNPAAEMQAIDRTHRIGQFKPIYATRFIIENTIEERILRLQEKKKLVFDGTVGGDAGSMSKLTVDDMRFLFN